MRLRDCNPFSSSARTLSTLKDPNLKPQWHLHAFTSPVLLSTQFRHLACNQHMPVLTVPTSAPISTCQCTVSTSAPDVRLDSPSYMPWVGFQVEPQFSPGMQPCLCNQGCVGLLRNLLLTVQI